ncbi:MAG: class I adenylate-forming enzyme family protein [Lysinibacillus sp.]
MNIGYFTENRKAAEHPTKIAIQFENGEKWSYRDLHIRSNKYANRLRELGVQKGDSVGLLMFNSLEYFALYFAIGKIGAIAVRINFRLTPVELDYILQDSRTKVLCAHAELLEKVAPLTEHLQIGQYIAFGENRFDWALSSGELEKGDEKDITDVDISLHDPVMLMYTSGTTGHPKGALWTHNTTFWFSTIQIMKWGFTGEEIAMTTGPLYHVGAMEDIALPVLLSGGTVIITQSGGFDIGRVLDVVEKEQVTDLFLFPFMIYDMLNLRNLEDYRLQQLKTIYTGGDPLMPWAIERAYELYPHVGIVQVYGLTEGQPIAACLDATDALKKSGSVGKPLPLTEIRLMDDEEQIVPTGEVGEVWIKSPGVSEGYWQKPEETAKSFSNGWCKTGDLGMYDEDGFLSIVGRKKDMIRSGGENIYAAEIEDVLYRHEAVHTASVIAIPDPKYLEAVCAVIVLKEDKDATEEELISFCQQYLAKYKAPKKVVFIDEIPRTPSGKVKKFELREMYKNINLATEEV